MIAAGGFVLSYSRWQGKKSTQFKWQNKIPQEDAQLQTNKALTKIIQIPDLAMLIAKDKDA